MHPALTNGWQHNSTLEQSPTRSGACPSRPQAGLLPPEIFALPRPPGCRSGSAHAGAGYGADMTTLDQANQASSMPTSRKILCVVYGAIAVAALIATFSQTLAYREKGAGSLLAYWEDARMLPASRALTSDLMLFGLAAVIFMVVEGRKHGIRFLWLYVAASYVVAISAAFPAFLIAREIRISKSDALDIRAIDAIVLAVVAFLTALLTIWIDLG